MKTTLSKLRRPPSALEKHTRSHESIHMCYSAVSTPPFMFFFSVILSWAYWKLPSAPLFSPLSFLFSPLLRWLIKSTALWYTAKPPGHFYELLGPLFLPSFHGSFLPSDPSPPFVRNERCNTLHSCNPGEHDFSLARPFHFLIGAFHVQQFLFGLLQEAAWLECIFLFFYFFTLLKATRGLTADSGTVSGMWFSSFRARHSGLNGHGQLLVSAGCHLEMTAPVFYSKRYIFFLSKLCSSGRIVNNMSGLGIPTVNKVWCHQSSSV